MLSPTSPPTCPLSVHVPLTIPAMVSEWSSVQRRTIVVHNHVAPHRHRHRHTHTTSCPPGPRSLPLNSPYVLFAIHKLTSLHCNLSSTSPAGPTPNSSRPTAASVGVTFAGLADGENVFGLGEHKNRRVEQGSKGGYSKKFADSLYYGYSQGGDVSIPWYMTSKG
jgi:hypothetical protein